MLEVLNPTGGPVRAGGPLARRLDTLNGKTVGVLWNSRAFGDRILKTALDMIGERYKLQEIVFRQKPFVGNVAPQAMFDEFAAKRVDAVVTGVGD